MTNDRTSRPIKPPIRRVDPDRDGAPDEWRLDEILADSFPASDPPPWTLGVLHTQTSSLTPPHRVHRKALE
jgi:hypothetical protein